MVNGIDVSGFQEDTDWTAVKSAGYSFAYIKATESVGYVSDTYDRDWAASKAAGLLRGAYHFYRFGASPEAQAYAFLAAYTPSAGDLPPMLDLEDPGYGLNLAQNVGAVAKWLQIVEAATKRRCILYMGTYYWQGALGGTDGFAGHPLWIAQYPEGPVTEESQPAEVPSPWPTWTFWQYSGSKAVPGVNGDCDADYFNGTLDELKAMCLP
jgi:lysozyme